ncbi:MAG TPA: ATP-binding protein [Bryobacteraceae bacterium]|nr:ATP-binding protein [Bryobacteraceae bacterium]
MPHGMCYLWEPGVLWLNVIADSLIAVAYYAIPFLLFYFVRRRRDFRFNAIFVAFGVFILACGTTHLMGAVTVWHPVYRLDGMIKAVTALASVTTFAMLIPLMPTLISFPSPAQLERVNATLAAEIDVRRTAEAEVRHINEELEHRVADRTADYKKALENLRSEMRRREELEQQLIQSQKMEAIGRLAGGVAHDFNNLLTVILGYNEMLREHLKSDIVGSDYVKEVLQASERASALTNQLLAFSRRQVSVPREVDLNDLVRNIDKMLRRIIGEDIRLDIRLTGGIPKIEVDPGQIDQVVMNLAVNSRDAMPAGGRLTIETARVDLNEEYAASHVAPVPGSYALLTVSDTGMGMDAATRARIFEPFFTTKAQGKGTGLGLSIVYGIVKQNGGEILVYSEPGKGTAFKVYIPAAKGSVQPVPVTAKDPLPEQATGTVLLVEDEDQVRNLTRAMLKRQGYRVFDFAMGAEALEFLRAKSEPIDLLISDIVMPQMNGLDLAREAQTLRPGMRLLLMSGYTETSVSAQGLIGPDTVFIHKPFTAATLREKVGEALR